MRGHRITFLFGMGSLVVFNLILLEWSKVPQLQVFTVGLIIGLTVARIIEWRLYK